ncbi:phage integrase family protein [Streptomyces sp. Ag109_G2-6]|uniref:tyrosine-type recombinase/integrase n=1 Tax=Streptomyces TaxID=1883 RepID=UPI000D1BDAAB|nr:MULTISPECIES: tyrosine-type recombinase/integrase [Streptomyces]RPF30164.1 phage integrase family protein [Streptomyces sp. Ag109_G2-6]
MRERLAAVRHQQLFFVGMHYRRRPTSPAQRKGGRRGPARKPPPAPAWRPDPGWRQPLLFEQIPRHFGRLDPADAALASPWLARAKYLAHRLAEARGWGRNIRFAVNRGLAVVLTGHVEGDVIRHTEIFSPLRALDLPVGHIVTVLEEMGIFEDDSEPSFERWLVGRLEGLAPGIRSEAERWTRVLRGGGPRSLPRREGTVWLSLNRVRPALLEWSNRCDHLREVTRGDVLAHMKSADGHHRHDQLVALRPLFTWAKRNGLIFRNPTSRIKVGQYEYAVLQPLLPEQVERSVAAATTPAARLILALAAVHAARVAQIATLTLDDVDLGNRRLTIAGRARPLDDLTLKLLTDWLDHRRHRWPSTANLHLLINNQTANTIRRASNHWTSAPMRGQDATLERLRVDRQLEEALTHGPGPLHLAEVFGLDEKTAMRYADSARVLLHQAAEQQLR